MEYNQLLLPVVLATIILVVEYFIQLFVKTARMKQLCFEILECERIQNDLVCNAEKIDIYCTELYELAKFCKNVRVLKFIYQHTTDLLLADSAKDAVKAIQAHYAWFSPITKMARTEKE